MHFYLSMIFFNAENSQDMPAEFAREIIKWIIIMDVVLCVCDDNITKSSSRSCSGENFDNANAFWWII